MKILKLCFWGAACALTTNAFPQTQADSVLPPFRTAAASARLDPGKMQWYDNWVTQYPDDAPPESWIEDPVELKRVLGKVAAIQEERRQAIRKDPEILPYLKAIFWLHHSSPENNGTGGVKSILEAMTLKPELTEADVADITAEFDRILATPFKGSDGDSHNYLLTFYAETIIRRFPTKANVARCVRIIQRSEDINWRFPKMWALKVLAEIGTEDTFGVAQQTLKWMEQKAENTLKGGVADEDAVEAKQLVETMRKRLDSTPSRDAAAVDIMNPPVPSAEAPTPAPLPSSVHPTASLSPLWLAAALLLLPVLFLLRKKPRI